MQYGSGKFKIFEVRFTQLHTYCLMGTDADEPTKIIIYVLIVILYYKILIRAKQLYIILQYIAQHH